jgi:hypothetical protein
MNDAIAKLYFGQKCEILAFCLCGVPVKIIADAFHVTPRTVQMIKSKKGASYLRVKTEVLTFNYPRQFCAHYITAEKERAIKELYPEYRLPPEK